MKTKNIGLVLIVALSAPIFAADFETEARVVGIQQNMTHSYQTQQDCSNVQYQPNNRGMGGQIIGGIAGGLLGNQIGNGNGRTAATAAGAIVGGIVGNNIQNDQGYQQQCRTVQVPVDRVQGYIVSYEYNGRVYQTVMMNDPGQTVRIRVSVNAIGSSY